MKWHGKRVLVTGAGGFIGSHLCEALVKQGADVTALIRYSSRTDWGNLEYLSKDLRDSLRVIPGNIEDPTFVEQLVNGKEYIFHLAALIGIPYSYIAPRSYLRTNVEGTINFLEAIRKFPVEAMVHTSTSEVYGTAIYTPINEDHPLQAQSPYASSKVAADKFVDSYFRSFGVRTVTLRPFNTFGPRQSQRAVIPAVISQTLTQSEIRVGSLSPKRDFVYVTDTVDAFLKAASTPEALGKTIHIGTGIGISIENLVGVVLDQLNCSKTIIEEQERVRPKESEVFELLCDPTLAKKILNWAPQVVFADGLKYATAFIQENLSRYRPSHYAT